jgi:HAD superfamily phosphoserine phosphatase-like hydrolase
MTKRIILSDVDGTITRGSLVLDHATMLHNAGVIDLGDLPARWNVDRKNEAIIHLLAEAYRDQISGFTLGDLQIVDFVDSVVADDTNFYDTLGRLKKASSEGDAVLLISCSPNYLVRKFAKAYGFQGIGSYYRETVEGKLTGEVDGLFNANAKRIKVASLKIRDSYDQVHAYGDTMSDEPLFDAADYSVLVQPTKETLDAIGHKVHELMY